MALADTAKLVASLELQDKFSRPLGNATAALGTFETKANTLGRIGGQLSSGIGAASQNLARIGVVGAGVLTVAITNGIRELEKLESATAQTNAVLESTQGVSGQTGDSIRALAEKYEGLNALIDDKVIQSGENVLLTFTNVRKEAFEPALEAALNLNQALGGGEEGLQNTIIQVGKALSDPIKGLTSLRRVGVVFNKDQEKQIRALVESNDLFGAQQVILAELAKEFGGSFAAAGDTAAGKFAKVRDAVEDAQAALATAFLPVLEKVADKLGTFLADPATVQRIQDFGGQLAGGLDKVLEIGGSLPWAEIGNAFTIVGTGSKALLDAFLGLPPWVQTAVLTGWGLNKLTGGALTGIAGTLTKALVSGGFGGRGSTALNPLYVQQVGLAGAGDVAAGTGIFSLLGTAFAAAAGLALVALIGTEINKALNPTGFGFNQVAGASGEFSNPQAAETFARNLADQLNVPLDTVKSGIVDAVNNQGLTFDQAVDALKKELTKAVGDVNRNLTYGNANAERVKATLDALPFGLGEQFSRLPAPIVNVSPNINVSLTSNVSVSVSNVVRTINSYTAAIGSGPGGAINPAL